MNRKEIENVECINFEEIQHKISRFYELANSLNYEVKKKSFDIESNNRRVRIMDKLEDVEFLVMPLQRLFRNIVRYNYNNLEIKAHSDLSSIVVDRFYELETRFDVLQENINAEFTSILDKLKENIQYKYKTPIKLEV